MTETQALIIDDDQNNLEVLARLLKVEGVSAVGVKDPTLTMNALANIAHLGVVFVDLEMANVDGYELLSMLREKIGKTAPIVCCSVHLAEMDNARRVGFDGFIGKPLDSDKFSSQFKRILKRQAVWELP